MADVVITGGAGFLGTRLARTLLAADTGTFGGVTGPLTRLTLFDRVEPPADLVTDSRVRFEPGDLLDHLHQKGGSTPWAEADVVFHLAAAVSAESEIDFDLGLRANLHATQQLLETLRLVGRRPIVVLAGSLAVYGSSPELPLPDVVSETTLPVPRSSYGTQKLVSEYLLADYDRKGYLRGRTARLMTVSVRPGRPNGAASGFLSGIIREPLAGQRAVCPVPPTTVVALSSPRRTVAGLVRVAGIPDEIWRARLALNLPALTVSVADMVQALGRVAGADTAGLIDWIPDESVAAIVRGWPARLDNSAARTFGLEPDANYESIVRQYLADLAE